MLGFHIEPPGSNKTNGENNLSFTASEEMKLSVPSNNCAAAWKMGRFRVE